MVGRVATPGTEISRAEIQYALVRDGQVLWDRHGGPEISGPFREKPCHLPPHAAAGCEWLPVFDRDARPFDMKKHYRLAPEYVLNGDHVERLYPVIDVKDCE